MSYSIVFPTTASNALSSLAPKGVSTEDATARLVSILKTDLGRIKFAPAKGKDGAKPKRLKFVKSKEKDDEGNPIRMAKYSTTVEGDASVAPQRSQDVYDFLWDLYEFEAATGCNADTGHVIVFPRHLASYIAKCLETMKPAATGDKEQTSATDAVPALQEV